MSAFLGPVHGKMYSRILYQDAMAQAMLELAEKNGWTEGLREQVDTNAPAASPEPLETIIDQSNIHGWLSEAVANSERRFAMIVSGILSKHPERIDVLQRVMEELGRQYAMPEFGDAEQAFQAVHDILLDGMPCDFPFEITASDTETVTWRVKTCPHTAYWTEELSAKPYYLLRDAWVKGALEGSGIVHTRSEGSHTMRKGR